MMPKNASLPSKIIRQIVKLVELKGPARLYVIEIICTPQQLHEERTFGGSLCSGHLFSASRLQLFVLSKSGPLQSTNDTATTWWPLCTSWKLLRLLFWFWCTKFQYGIAFVCGDSCAVLAGRQVCRKTCVVSTKIVKEHSIGGPQNWDWSQEVLQPSNHHALWQPSSRWCQTLGNEIETR